MNRRNPTWPSILALAMIAAWLCFAAISPHRTGAFAEGGETTQARRAPDERAALIEAALFTRGEFFGAQALIPYPTAEARSRLAEVQNKYPEDPAIYSRLAQLDEKLGHQEQALNELREPGINGRVFGVLILH